MSGASVAARPATPARRPRRTSPVRAALGWLGELMMTAGVLCLLFVLWQLWWTDVESNRAQDSTVSRLEASFGPAGAGATRTTSVDPAQVRPPRLSSGEPFAVIRVPRFGADYARPIFEGVGHEILDEGVGHYTDTVGPGEVGNFSLAGHRVTYGKPFNQIAELRAGDRVIIETATGYAVYAVRSHQIVLPSESSVIAPAPNHPGQQPTHRWLTMTACHPMFSARERYVVHAELVATYPRAGGLPAAETTIGG